MSRFWGTSLAECVNLPGKPVIKLSHHGADSFGLAHIISNPQIKSLSHHEKLFIHPTRFFLAQNIPNLEPAILAELAPENKCGNLHRAEEIIRQKYSLPPEWEFKIYADFCNCVYGAEMYLACYLQLKNSFFPPDVHLPDKSAYWGILSGNLQLGERVNLDNYPNYQHNHKCTLKFLPFIIGERQFSFFVLPYPEKIALGIGAFKKTLNQIQPLLPLLRGILTRIHSLIKMSDIRRALISQDLYEEGRSLNGPLEEMEAQIQSALAPFSKEFGYVYKDMRGSKITLPFSGFHTAFINGPKFPDYRFFFGQ